MENRETVISDEMPASERLHIPFWLKSNLTVEEAAAYSGVGRNKLRELTDSERNVSIDGYTEKPEGEMWRMIIESRAALEFSSRPGQKTVLDKMRYNSYNDREGEVLQERNHSV